MQKTYLKKMVLKTAIPVLIIGVFYVALRAYASLGKGYSWKEMDWDKDGKTSLSELLRASDVGVREIQKEGETCKEFFDYKDGRPIRSRCSKFSGSDYWFYKLVSKKFEKQNIGNSIVLVKYLFQDNWKTFRIKKEKTEEYQNIYDGYSRAIGHYSSYFDYSHPGFKYRKKKKPFNGAVAKKFRRRITQLTGGGKKGWDDNLSHRYLHWRFHNGDYIGESRYSDCFKGIVREVPHDWYWRFMIIKKSVVLVKEKDKYGYMCLRLSPESPGFVIKPDKIQEFQAKSDEYKRMLHENMAYLNANQTALDHHEQSGKKISFSDEDYEVLVKEHEGDILSFFHEEYEAYLKENPYGWQDFYYEKDELVAERYKFRQKRQDFKDGKQEIIQELTILTGMDFKTYKEWSEWYKKNKNRLVLSEEKGHLIVRY